MRKKGSLAEWDRVRWIAANMFDQNKTPAQIAACLGVAAQTVRQWRRLYRQSVGWAVFRPPIPFHDNRLNSTTTDAVGGVLPTPQRVSTASRGVEVARRGVEVARRGVETEHSCPLFFPFPIICGTWFAEAGPAKPALVPGSAGGAG